MTDVADYRARIPQVVPDASRPLWSVMIPTFNCASYLRETLRGVLVQDRGPDAMQIEVVDDHSADNPQAVVQEIGRGRVIFHRQPRNVGTTLNFQACIARARGRLVHLLHGDDYVLDGFYASMERAFASRPEIGAAFCRHLFVNAQGEKLAVSDLEQPASGILENWLERLASEQRIMTPSIVVRREVYETLGAFDSRLICAEDWEMWVRIAAHYPVWYEVAPLAAYRMHEDSNTGRHTHAAEDIRYTRLAIEMFTAYLPADRAESIRRRARETYALSAIHQAQALWSRRDRVGAIAQLREALKLSHSLKVMAALGSALLRRRVVASA